LLYFGVVKKACMLKFWIKNQKVVIKDAIRSLHLYIDVTEMLHGQI